MVTTERGDAPTDGAVERTTLEPTGPRDGVPLLLRAVRSMTRLTRPLAGRRSFPLWAVLHHRGRRSGRAYAVPVGVRATADAYFIALPFGERTQWVRNVVAARGCTVRWRGEDLVMEEPTLVGSDQAAPAFPPAMRWMLRVAGVQLFMRLRPAGGPVG
jgi:deazaflavin-dependent oxidoreductase (nitroreductase family)